MPSLYKDKVIKKDNINEQGKRKINTQYVSRRKNELGEKNAKDFIDNYEILARNIVENAREKGNALLSKAYDEVSKIQKEAYEKGYNEGHDEGFESGISKANKHYEDVKKQIEIEKEQNEETTSNMLLNSKEEYVKYLNEKKDEIKELVLEIAENILKREVKDEKAITNMIVDAIKMAKKSKNVVVRCKNVYVEDVKKKVEEFKCSEGFIGEIFVVGDDNLNEGEAVIKRENGKITVNIRDALDKVKEILMSEEC